MNVGEHVGFWSYAHRDNNLDHGRVARLAKDIADEFELQTGETLKMFVDRDSISWGDEWRKRVDHALGGSAFFIAIITPLYLRSVECRREFLDFSSQLSTKRHRKILLPIIYSNISAPASTESKDPIVELALRTQYEDWRRLRLSKDDSQEYRRKVHDMSIRIIEILRT